MPSSNVEKLINEIYADSRVSPAEIIRLREAVDAAEQRILQEEGLQGTMSALCKSFDVTNQLLQTSMLELRKSGGTDLAFGMVAAMVEANLALLKANVDAFSQ